MLLRMSYMVCILAAMTAYYAQAQESASKSGAKDASQAGTDAGAAQNPANPTGKSEARSGDSQKDAADAQDRTRDTSPRTSGATNQSDASGNQNKGERRRRLGRADVEARATVTREGQGASSDHPLDSPIANCLVVGNQKEVAISQFAAERSKNEKVKEFARKMVQDHSQAITKLQRFASEGAANELGSTQSTRIQRSQTTVNERSTTTDVDDSQESKTEARDSDRRGSSKRDAKKDATPGADAATPGQAGREALDRPTSSTESVQENEGRTSERRAEGAERRTTATGQREGGRRDRAVTTSVDVRTEHEAMPEKMLAIEREIAQKCISLAKAELEQSTNFDQAFVGLQISEHIGMIAKLETFKSYASEDLGKVLQESLQTTQEHLRHAKELVKDLAASDSSTSARGQSGIRSETGSRGEAKKRSDAENQNESGVKRESGARRQNEAPKQ